MKVYLLRHGEVENPNKVLYGRLPGFYLSDLGRKHVEQTALKLANTNIKKIYSSPLERTVETSEIILNVLGLSQDDLIIDERLIESDVSKWEGTDLEDYKKKIVFGMSARNQKEYELITVAGKRVLSVLNEPVKKNGQDALIVSHGDPLMGAIINLTGDWSFVEERNIADRYIKRAEYILLESTKDSWKVKEFSY